MCISSGTKMQINLQSNLYNTLTRPLLMLCFYQFFFMVEMIQSSSQQSFQVVLKQKKMVSSKANGRELRSCLGRVFKFKLSCFCYECNFMAYTSTPTPRVENSAQVLSYQLKFVCLNQHGVVVSRVPRHLAVVHIVECHFWQNCK